MWALGRALLLFSVLGRGRGQGRGTDQGRGATPQGRGAPSQGRGAPPQGRGAPPQGRGAPPQEQGAPPQEQGAPPQGRGFQPPAPSGGEVGGDCYCSGLSSQCREATTYYWATLRWGRATLFIYQARGSLVPAGFLTAQFLQKT